MSTGDVDLTFEQFESLSLDTQREAFTNYLHATRMQPPAVDADGNTFLHHLLAKGDIPWLSTLLGPLHDTFATNHTHLLLFSNIEGEIPFTLLCNRIIQQYQQDIPPQHSATSVEQTPALGPSMVDIPEVLRDDLYSILRVLVHGIEPYVFLYWTFSNSMTAGTTLQQDSHPFGLLVTISPAFAISLLDDTPLCWKKTTPMDLKHVAMLLKDPIAVHPIRPAFENSLQNLYSSLNPGDIEIQTNHEERTEVLITNSGINENSHVYRLNPAVFLVLMQCNRSTITTACDYWRRQDTYFVLDYRSIISLTDLASSEVNNAILETYYHHHQSQLTKSQFISQLTHQHSFNPILHQLPALPLLVWALMYFRGKSLIAPPAYNSLKSFSKRFLETSLNPDTLYTDVDDVGHNSGYDNYSNYSTYSDYSGYTDYSDDYDSDYRDEEDSDHSNDNDQDGNDEIMHDDNQDSSENPNTHTCSRDEELGDHVTMADLDHYNDHADDYNSPTLLDESEVEPSEVEPAKIVFMDPSQYDDDYHGDGNCSSAGNRTSELDDEPDSVDIIRLLTDFIPHCFDTNQTSTLVKSTDPCQIVPPQDHNAIIDFLGSPYQSFASSRSQSPLVSLASPFIHLSHPMYVNSIMETSTYINALWAAIYEMFFRNPSVLDDFLAPLSHVKLWSVDEEIHYCSAGCNEDKILPISDDKHACSPILNMFSLNQLKSILRLTNDENDQISAFPNFRNATTPYDSPFQSAFLSSPVQIEATYILLYSLSLSHVRQQSTTWINKLEASLGDKMYWKLLRYAHIIKHHPNDFTYVAIHPYLHQGIIQHNLRYPCEFITQHLGNDHLPLVDSEASLAEQLLQLTVECPPTTFKCRDILHAALSQMHQGIIQHIRNARRKSSRTLLMMFQTHFRYGLNPRYHGVNNRHQHLFFALFEYQKASTPHPALIEFLYTLGPELLNKYSALDDNAPTLSSFHSIAHESGLDCARDINGRPISGGSQFTGLDVFHYLLRQGMRLNVYRYCQYTDCIGFHPTMDMAHNPGNDNLITIFVDYGASPQAKAAHGRPMEASCRPQYQHLVESIAHDQAEPLFLTSRVVDVDEE